MYTRGDLKKLFHGLPFKIERMETIFGAYDNIIEKQPLLGKMLRAVLYLFEKTHINRLGLSHFWVLRKR